MAEPGDKTQSFELKLNFAGWTALFMLPVSIMTLDYMVNGIVKENSSAAREKRTYDLQEMPTTSVRIDAYNLEITGENHTHSSYLENMDISKIKIEKHDSGNGVPTYSLKLETVNWRHEDLIVFVETWRERQEITMQYRSYEEAYSQAVKIIDAIIEAKKAKLDGDGYSRKDKIFQISDARRDMGERTAVAMAAMKQNARQQPLTPAAHTPRIRNAI